jgi:catechol 2,3-dioxygenase-like lactoylglutathione lyase family enzyme
MPDITGIAHVELSVRDLDRSVAWYTRLLGASDVWRGSNDEYGITACAIYEPKSRMVFAFTRHAVQDPESFSPCRLGLDHVSFGVAGRAALEEWVRWLDELGIEHSPIQDDHTPPSVTFRDPDGIALELSYPPARD